MPVPSGHLDEWAELAVDYLDGRAAPEAKAGIQSHLRECPECAARLRTQQSVVTFLQETYLDDPPIDLEDRVLGEVLFPSQPVAAPRKEEPKGWSATWNKRIRPWIPATIAVVALMAAVIGYGVARSGNDLSTEGGGTSQPVAAVEQTSDSATREETLSDTSTTAAAATTTATVVAAGGTESTVPVTASGLAEPVFTVEKKAMVAELGDAEAPAYLAFMAAAPEQSDDSGSTEVSSTATESTSETSAGDETGVVSTKQVEDVASQITTFTGLTPLDASLWLGGPTFAAYLPREDAEELVDLVRSIATSVGLVVGLIVAPPAGAAEANARLLENKRDLCVLAADRAPQPAVMNWNFTTSTLLPSGDQEDGVEWVPPDEAGGHVLVVIYVQNP